MKHTPKYEALLIKAKDTFEILSVSTRKLWSMTASGEIPHVRLGRSVRYRMEDLREFIAANTSPAKDR